MKTENIEIFNETMKEPCDCCGSKTDRHYKVSYTVPENGGVHKPFDTSFIKNAVACDYEKLRYENTGSKKCLIKIVCKDCFEERVNTDGKLEYREASEEIPFPYFLEIRKEYKNIVLSNSTGANGSWGRKGIYFRLHNRWVFPAVASNADAMYKRLKELADTGILDNKDRRELADTLKADTIFWDIHQSYGKVKGVKQ